MDVTEIKTDEAYDFDSIKLFICDRLGIPVEQFGDYEADGMKRDLWFVWLEMADTMSDVANGHACPFWFDSFDDYEYDRLVDSVGDWVKVLRPILNELQNHIGIGALVHYYW